MIDVRDVYNKITGRIVADLERGVRPWMQPWSAAHAAGRITRPLRHNGVPYKGINVVMLWSASVEKGYARNEGMAQPDRAHLWQPFPPPRQHGVERHREHQPGRHRPDAPCSR